MIGEEIDYYYQERGYGDPNARRFEEGARRIAFYNYPCVALTYPYTPLTWLMVEFIAHYYLADPVGFETADEAFWKRAESSSLYQYEQRVNRSAGDYCRRIAANVVEIYRRIIGDGFNLAKPVPVAENPDGVIVPLKGAKRIAALIALGVETVPVAEFATDTLSSISEKQSRTSCVDHATLIFDRLGELPAVRALETQYRFALDEAADARRGRLLGELEKVMKEFGRSSAYRSLVEREVPFSNEASRSGPVRLRTSDLIIEREVEAIVWLIRRRQPLRVAVLDPSVHAAVAPLLSDFGIECLADATELRAGMPVNLRVPSRGDAAPLGFALHDSSESRENASLPGGSSSLI
ncbi:hypothetical protein D5125_03880 [Magnetovirga frankeli]|uniref:hypothetical protein n=1 Tax=Magnetovirga frankeli TaxID=947516 RepID=UPI001292E89D|nr:hypothetical protein D5125_03880 [gamma proteobacterium SS-5]